MGCVYEPYLQGSPNVGIFFERLLQGCNFAESAYASQQMLSWQTTFVGDPLYRPCALSLDEQIARLEKAGNPDVVFAHLRRINLLRNEKKEDEALRYALQLNGRLNSNVLAEKIADMLLDRDVLGAIQNYKEAAKLATDEWVAIRLQYKLAEAYLKLGKNDLALQSLETILHRWPNYEGKTGLYVKLIPLAYKVGPLTRAKAWKEEALKFDASLTNNPALK
jgi:tetratricopeptide (TPR) repeat protein